MTSIRDRLYRVGMAVLGPAPAGPYGPTQLAVLPAPRTDRYGRRVLTCGCVELSNGNKIRRH